MALNLVRKVAKKQSTTAILLKRWTPLVSLCAHFEPIAFRSKSDHSKNWRVNRKEWGKSVLLTSGTALISYAAYKWYAQRRDTLQALELNHSKYGEHIPGLKSYSMEEVSKHSSIEKRIWVTFKNGVYDVTDFVHEHPGGDNIMMGAGGAVDPFWELYAVHKNEKVLDILEKYRIGNLNAEDRHLTEPQAGNPYSTDPRRHPALQPRSVTPFNAEPPLEILVKNFRTPNELFFVRNHLPVPIVDINEYKLEIEGIGLKKSFALTLNDLKNKFPKHSVTTAIQCAGNRRSEMIEYKEVRGLSWGPAAISNAKWSGARLSDVLKYCGLDLNDERIKHVQFDGLDQDPAGQPYGASIPADIALDPKSQFILAYEMNDEEIPRDHGFPIRLIAPGIVGARNVKWLGRIVLSDEESHSHWQRNDYKGFSPNVDWDTVDFDKAPAIQDLPVQSAICKPANGEVLRRDKNGCIKVEGYAWSGGGRKIVRVDVSADGGKNWTVANLKQEATPLNRTYSWTLWEVNLPIKEGNAQLICKAIDSAYNGQPETVPPIWNLRGVLSNAWHRVNVQVE
ncbi:putative sulfite oxidase-like protein [Dinothrombium tinctorium]|uniref:Sulfite oxidase n=1 Tax=Dinothrombium tinctorium TaxID=1965070 RepID=A0A3S4RL86_9ACAR|nr:putative sulfite oxidase-like protein [Dinothrombium tinctorium]RWS17587.1 putative sulfite oxidase-like protein [Dinothrombium tinctorium]RWS17740.1 putative sulfite oxidase-like protein [Dinothrombium tinctorium]